MRDKLGVCQWFHYEDFRDLERGCELLRELGVRHLRTGISWADFHRERGRAWYDYQMEALADFHVLLSVWHTPPSIAEGGTTAGPPLRLRDYADFIDVVIERWGDRFQELELWNEPNNRLKWDFANHDATWSKFGEMIASAAHWASRRGKRTVLGGMIPVDPRWLALMKSHHALHDVDVIAIHGFPEMWWPDRPSWDRVYEWQGWEPRVVSIARDSEGRPVWITETGLATWDLPGGRHDRYELQAKKLREAAAAPAERVYWYSLIDLDPARSAIEGFHVDENEYHMGLVDFEGRRKPAFEVMKSLLEE